MMNRLRPLGWLTGAAALGLVAGSVPAPAQACGGFFCNNQTMDQTAEEILFGVDPDSGTVRAVIRIFYQGDAADFGWVLPLPSVPTLSVGSEAVFTTLRQRTQPTFTLEMDEASQNCFWRNQVFPSAADGGGEGGSTDFGGNVQVLDSGQVGSFEYAVVDSDDASELVTWLNDNGFVQPPAAESLLAHYLAKDMVFVALKLQQNAGSGDIAPVVLDFAEQAPCVPLVLTQIAAQPDMPVRVWVASKERAIPKNWLEVEPNLAKIDWLNSGSNYNTLVRDAIDEASGRAFVTEYAGSPDLLAGAFYTEGQYDLQALKAAGSAQAWIGLVKQQFSSSPALLALFQSVLPLPAQAAAKGISEQDFYNFEDEYGSFYELIDFDSAVATSELDERIVTPLRDAQELVDRYPYLTRLTTVISPDEMTRDPLFAFNSGIGDVALEHKAIGVIQCDNNTISDVKITLPGGAVVSPEIPSWWGVSEGYVADDLEALPNASAIHLVPTTGAKYAIDAALVEFVDDQLTTKTADLVIADLEGTGGGGGGGTGGGGGSTRGDGCAASGATGAGTSGACALAFGLLGLLGLTIRRRLR